VSSYATAKLMPKLLRVHTFWPEATPAAGRCQSEPEQGEVMKSFGGKIAPRKAEGLFRR
jgi:hypothetical protein